MSGWIRYVAIAIGLIALFLIIYVTALWLFAMALDRAVHEETGHCACRPCAAQRDRATQAADTKPAYDVAMASPTTAAAHAPPERRPAIARLIGRLAVALTRLAHRLGAHVYLSTSCLHEEHEYCQAQQGRAGVKNPAECKFCEAPCTCGCHKEKR